MKPLKKVLTVLILLLSITTCIIIIFYDNEVLRRFAMVGVSLVCTYVLIDNYHRQKEKNKK